MAELKDKVVTLEGIDYFNRNVAAPHQSSITMIAKALNILSNYAQEEVQYLDEKTDYILSGGTKNIMPSGAFDKASLAGHAFSIIVNRDFSISLSGTISGTAEDTISKEFFLPAGKYILSKGIANSDSINTPDLNLYNSSNNTIIATCPAASEFVSFTTTSDLTVLCKAKYYSGRNYTGVTFYPMVMIDSILLSKDYAPFFDSNLELTHKVRNIESTIASMSNPYELYDFTQSGSGTILPMSSSTAISGITTGRIDITLPAAKQADWKIASMAKYELVDSSNTRIDAVQVFSFSMSSQTVLRVGFRTSGSTNKSFATLKGALLLSARE